VHEWSSAGAGAGRLPAAVAPPAGPLLLAQQDACTRYKVNDSLNKFPKPKA